MISGEVIVAGGRGRQAGAVNALQTGRRRATKKATAYSKATVQLLSHTKHSNALCKVRAGEELRVDLSQTSHLRHTQTKLGPHPLMPCEHHSFVCCPLCVCALRKYKIPGLIGHTMSLQISQVHIFYLYPELNHSFFSYCVRSEIIHLFQQQSRFGPHFHRYSPANFSFQ